ncbi:MAG TPA: DUF222 domain-containing protein [Streptosporangiaceae bacterium]|nr:DUF222 domain-containing protein [Streptosporangiaceae bacterium]
MFAQIAAERRRRAAAAAKESLAAGFQSRAESSSSRPGTGFESGGALDTQPPDGLLAALADAATRDGRLAGLDDDELIGILRAWHRLGSWCASGLLTAVAELARRRPAEATAPAAPGAFPEQLSEFVSDEIAAALTLTARRAETCQDLSLDLARRLPGTAKALHEGVIDPPKAQLIAEATRILTDEQARQVEALILPRAGQQTTGQLRAAVARAVLAADPEAAIRRREEAQKDPRVRRWQEDTGTAALAGYGLPPAEVLAADQRLTDQALALRQAGRPGSLDVLRARAYLDALLGQDSTPLTAPAPKPEHQPTLAARVTLTVPLSTYLGSGTEPGRVAGYGPIDPALARELTVRAAAHPASRFCLTVTGPDGRAIGHGCIPGRPPDPTTQPRPPGSNAIVTPLAGADCDHRHQEPGYQPSRWLQHLITARTPTCTAPGCARPAARCDLDHTTPYDQGGRTCECNLAPLCRHHHRCKQSEGWQLHQLSPGVMSWTTPAGRRYVTRPGD